MIADIIACIILVACVFIGIKKGFTSIVMQFASLALSIWAAVMFYDPFMNFINSFPPTASFVGALKHFFATLIAPALGGSDVTLPDALSRFINPEIIAQGKWNVALAISDVITSVILMLVFIIIIKLAIYFISKFLKIVAKLPVLKQANKLLGALAGFAYGICICYITSLVLFMLQTAYYPVISYIMNDSFLMSYFTNTNALINVILG